MLPIIAATGGRGGRLPRLQPPSGRRSSWATPASMFLGFVVAAVAISLTQDGVDPVARGCPSWRSAMPLADTVWAIVRRTARGEPFFVADRGHIHHQLLRLGLQPARRDAAPHRRVGRTRAARRPARRRRARAPSVPAAGSPGRRRRGRCPGTSRCSSSAPKMSRHLLADGVALRDEQVVHLRLGGQVDVTRDSRARRARCPARR